MVKTVSLIDTACAALNNVKISDSGEVLAIAPCGYGDHYSEDGTGSPILLEFVNGVPRLLVWADINEGDPTHVIDLGGASESLRREIED
jgi:hypothetical protein